MHKTVSVDIQKKDQIVFACELCEYTCSLTIKLKHHMNKKHPQMTDISAYSCETCNFEAENLVDMWSHRESEHASKAPDFQPKSKQEMAYIA